MDRRRAIKFGAIAVAISVVIAIAAYIGVGIAVATMLGNAGFQWKTMERNGFSWAFTDIASPSITATRARLDLGSSSRFTLQRAALDLAAASENQTLGAAFSSVPKWLYVSADPLTVRWRTRTLASGLRSRLAKSSIVATGPTMSIRGTVGPDGVALKLSGELNADALSAKGDAQLRLSVSNGGQAQVEANLSQVKLVVPQASSKPIVFEAVKLTATGDLQQTTGTLTVGDLTGTVALRCTQASPATCSVRINVEGNLGPVLTELSELTRMSRTPKSQGTFAAELEGNLTTKTATLTVHTDAVRVSGTGVDIAKLNGYFEFEGAAPDGSSLMIEGGPDSSGWVDREGTPAHIYAALVASAAGRHSRTTLDLAGFKLSIEGRHETSSIGAAGALVDYIQQDKRADALVLMMERWLFAAE
ncbi:MAG: hypothetical protein HOI95_28385, partial [Chromatiales bacterium]|nr:hypothetical protein [Chromatiales bacterium]